MSARSKFRSPRPAISAIVTTFNEEANIAACIESLLWCDEILVVDSFSTDRTPEICRAYDKVRFFQRTYFGSASQKNWAMDQVTNDWILIFDADERCTPALQREIEELLAREDRAQHPVVVCTPEQHLLARGRFDGPQSMVGATKGDLRAVVRPADPVQGVERH